MSRDATAAASPATGGSIGAELRRVVAEETTDRAFAARVLREVARFAALRLRRGYPARLLATGLRTILREHAAVGAAPADLRGYVCRVLEQQLPQPLRRGWHWQRAGAHAGRVLGEGRRGARVPGKFTGYRTET